MSPASGLPSGPSQCSRMPSSRIEVHLREADVVLLREAPEFHALLVTAIVLTRPEVALPRVLLDGALALGGLGGGDLREDLAARALRAAGSDSPRSPRWGSAGSGFALRSGAVTRSTRFTSTTTAKLSTQMRTAYATRDAGGPPKSSSAKYGRSFFHSASSQLHVTPPCPPQTHSSSSAGSALTRRRRLRSRTALLDLHRALGEEHGGERVAAGAELAHLARR